MRNFILICLFLLSTNSFANSRGQIIQNISRLSARIQIKAQETNVSNEELRIVQNSLKTILNKLNNQTDYGCLEFTLEIYERTYSGTTALNKAQEACNKITDVPLVKFVYEVYLESYSDRFALDRSIDRTASKDYFGKSDELEFVYGIYKESYSSNFAIERSLDMVELISGDSMKCLEVSYRSLSRSYSSKFAIDRAIESCR